MMMKSNRLFSAYLFVLCLCLTTACQNGSRLEGLVPASGVVMFEKKPVEGASVIFAPISTSGEKRVATATTDAKGHFSMMTLNPGDGVYPGEYAVTVAKAEQLGEVVVETLPDGRVQRNSTDGRIRNLLPLKYADAKTSELKVVISEKGDKKIEFQLEGEIDDTPKAPGGPRQRPR